jgi:hypothetical protein
LKLTKGSGGVRNNVTGEKAEIRIGEHPTFTSNVVQLQVKEKPLPAATQCIG